MNFKGTKSGFSTAYSIGYIDTILEPTSKFALWFKMFPRLLYHKQKTILISLQMSNIGGYRFSVELIGIFLHFAIEPKVWP